MNKFVITLAFVLAAFAQGGNYRVTDGREVISEYYDYSFALPDKWYISASNPAPFMFNFSPEKLASAGVGLPPGGATISLAADAESHRTGSITRWIEVDRAAHRFSSVRTLNLLHDASVDKITETVSTETTSEDSRIRLTALYFNFQQHPFAAYLRYNSGDRNGPKFDLALLNMVKSLHPLYGPHGTDCCCKR